MLALWAIFVACGVLLVGISTLQDVYNGRSTGSAMWGLFGVWGASMVALWVAWNPIFYLTLILFYLDLRIRKEALDLEWTAHTTTPAEALNASQSPARWDTGSMFGSTGTVENGATFVSLAPTGSTEPTGGAWYDAVPLAPTTPVPSARQEPAPGVVAPRVICAHCGASVPAADFCSNCQARLPVADTLGDSTPGNDVSFQVPPSQP
jgi:hypothetical protein